MSKIHLPWLSLLFLFSIIKPHASFPCSTDSNFTSNSTYETNVNQLLASLTAAAVPSGYANKSQGQPPDQVFGLALCRGDLMLDECQACLATAIHSLRTGCPLGKDASTWQGNCSLAYSSTNFSTNDKASYHEIWYRVDETDEPGPFSVFVYDMMGALINSTAYLSRIMFAMADAEFTHGTTVYGLVQCTRDQSGDECKFCLQHSLSIFQACCSRNLGGVVLKYHCYFRYETYMYYNMTMPKAPLPPLPSRLSSMSPPSPPLPSPIARGAPPFTDAGFVDMPDATGKKKETKMVLLLVAVLCGSMAVALLVFCFWRRRSKLGEEESQHTKKSPLFDIDTLRAATNNFSDENKLGEGGFGPVYKGILAGGRQVAVKRLSTKSRQGLSELKNEVCLITKLHHKNLVTLLGYCLAEEKLLVYEFLPNASLDKILFDPQRCCELNWERRYNIIDGIANGLVYLHHDSSLMIIHRDLKPGNILLDQHMKAKISDFGLSTLFNSEISKAYASQVAGTSGYMAPEYAWHRQFSTKSDVYSFGVIVLEIITGRGVGQFNGYGRHPNLHSFAWKYWKKGDPLGMVDKNLGERYSNEEALRCIHMALLCIQDDPSQRPSMASVALMLSCSSMTMPSPPAPGVFIERYAISDPSGSTVQRKRYPNSVETKNNAKAIVTMSVNEVTESSIEPR